MKTHSKLQKRKIDQNITAQYEALLEALKRSNETELDKNKEEIKRLLVDELIIRFQYREGLYNYYLKANTEIQKAIQILNDKSKYNSILKK